MMEEDEFAFEMKKLKANIDVWFELQKGNHSKETKVFENHRNFNLYNSIAKERYSLLHKLRTEIL